MTENKRFELVWKDTGEVLHDNKTGLDKGIYSPDYRFHVRNMMNELAEENEQLKQSVNNLKDTIIKITIAYQRKYDRTIVDLVDEVFDEDITDLIKELKE